MENNLISIIVPVYNVEKYIARCLESIIKQTYKNLQIIVVNDGSEDNSILIANAYRNKDSRIEIYNKKNGGVSSARNFGLRVVKGDYICFVDSDDWIDECFIEILYDHIITSDAQISCGNFVYAYDDKVINQKYFLRMKEVILQRTDSLEQLCRGKWLTNHVWNKMYKTSLFDSIEFEENRCFEDIFIMHLLFERAEKVSCSKDAIYYYYMRDNSIIHQENPQHTADIFIGYRSRFLYFKDPYLQSITLKYCAWACYQVLFLCDQSKINRKDVELAMEFWQHNPQIKTLGIKYYILYSYPQIYKRLFLKEI